MPTHPDIGLCAATASVQACPCRSVESLAIRRCIQCLLANSVVRPVPCLLAAARPILAYATARAPMCPTLAAIATAATTAHPATPTTAIASTTPATNPYTHVLAVSMHSPTNLTSQEPARTA